MESNLLFQRPIHLLQPTADRSKLMLNPDALKALKSIAGPVVLVAIVGMPKLFFSLLLYSSTGNQRGGKSTLLNLMHSRQTSGFGLGHSYDAQTTGFWVWARKHPRNEELTVILMDTEGLDTPHSTRRFSFIVRDCFHCCCCFFHYYYLYFFFVYCLVQIGRVL
jgi:hypothetical protein